MTPYLASLVGGMILGLSAALLLVVNGRIAGISGIVGGLLLRPRGDMDWRIAFLIGLMGAPVVAALLGHPVVPEIAAGWGEVLAAGFLVGIGTRYAGGCTSGHGVCGLSRGSVRSLVATLSFVTAGIVTVFVVRHVFGG